MSLNTVYNLIYEYADKKQPMIDPQLAFLVMNMTEDEAKEKLVRGIIQKKIDMLVITHVTGTKRFIEDTDESDTLSRIAGTIVREVLTTQGYLSYINCEQFDAIYDYQVTVYRYLATMLRMPKMLEESKLNENRNYMIESIKRTINSKNN